MTGPAPTWRLKLFVDALDRWEQVEQPDDDLRLMVTAWVFARHDDPFADVQREPGFDSHWSGVIPGTLTASTAVVCTYFIEVGTHTVTCSSLATLNLPI